MVKAKNQFKNITPYYCSSCNINTWNNKPICLEIDHIDGNNSNNDITNFRYLCPNCHSQTDTFRAKNIKKRLVTDIEFLEVLKTTDNIRQALIKLNLTPKAANYKRAHNLLGTIYKNIDIKNSQYGTVWINNSIENKKIKKEKLGEYETLGWSLGRLRLNWSIPPPNNKNSIWITNGYVNKMIKSENIPKGWWKGKVQSTNKW